MKNENPCKNCLIVMICKKTCINLRDFSRTVPEYRKLKFFGTWLNKYEIRPRVKEMYSEIEILP